MRIEIEEESKHNEECPCMNRPKILVVDDNIFNIIAVQAVIEGNPNYK